jgi:RNA polymerase sigma-70 factor (ECF subfamily)
MQMAKGDEFAFREIYDRYWYGIYKTVFRYTKSKVIAEDIVQEVFTILWNKRSQFTAVIHLERYLITIARNITYRTLQQIAQEKTVSQTIVKEKITTENHTDDRLLEKQYDELLKQAVHLLPTQQKQVFQLAKVHGLSQKDIAQQLNISRFTVKTHMAKALQSIRHYLQPYLGHYLIYVAITIHFFS